MLISFICVCQLRLCEASREMCVKPTRVWTLSLPQQSHSRPTVSSSVCAAVWCKHVFRKRKELGKWKRRSILLLLWAALRWKQFFHWDCEKARWQKHWLCGLDTAAQRLHWSQVLPPAADERTSIKKQTSPGATCGKNLRINRRLSSRVIHSHTAAQIWAQVKHTEDKPATSNWCSHQIPSRSLCDPHSHMFPLCPSETDLDGHVTTEVFRESAFLRLNISEQTKKRSFGLIAESYHRVSAPLISLGWWGRTKHQLQRIHCLLKTVSKKRRNQGQSWGQRSEIR